MDVYAWLLILALFVGAIGTFVPMVPGMWLIFASLLVYGIFDHWVAYPIWFVILVGVLAFACSFLDYLGTLIGAKKFGASNMTAVGAMVGSVAGGLIGNLPGTLAGGVIGSIGAEYKNHRSIQKALRATLGTFIGTAVASFIQFIIAIIIVVIAVIKVWGVS